MSEEQDVGFTNDHGILYLCDDVRNGEWLHMHDIPDRLENRC